jgi:hypothetical protein
MESIDDILRLPLAEDVQNDKYYHFNPFVNLQSGLGFQVLIYDLGDWRFAVQRRS